MRASSLCLLLCCIGLRVEAVDLGQSSPRPYPAGKAQVVVTLPAQTYQSYFLDFPSNVSEARAITSGASGEVDLFVRRGTPHRGTSLQALVAESLYVSTQPGGSESIIARRGQAPGLTAGRWWATVSNPTTQAVAVTLDMSFTTSGAPFSIAPGTSGSWSDPRKSGQGFFLQLLDPSTAIVAWFTYDPQGNQAYLVGTGRVQGDQILITDLIRSRGARFGRAFRASDVVREDWGDLLLTFETCGRGYAAFTPSTDWPFEQLDVERLTSISGVACDGPAADAKTSYVRGGMSGAWFDPRRAGEGWMVEVISADLALVYWFSYTPDGQQAWFGNVGQLVDGSIVVASALQPVGGRFGPDYQASQIALQPWGAFVLTFTGCGTAVAAGIGPPTYGSIEYAALQRITGVAGVDTCALAEPPRAVSGSGAAPPNTFLDGDVNDPNSPERANNSFQQAQLLASPAVVTGYATAIATGTSGDRFSARADAFDFYRVTMARGQVARVAIADHDANAPTRVDLDLFLYRVTDTANPVASSQSTGPLDQVAAPDDGEYFVVVNAFGAASAYVLSVDNSAARAMTIAGALSAFDDIVLDEIIIGFEDNDKGRQAKRRLEVLPGLAKVYGEQSLPHLFRVDSLDGASKKLGIAPPADALELFSDDTLDRRNALVRLTKALRGVPGIKFAEPNSIVHANAIPTDPGYAFQWHYPAIGLPQAWDITTGSPSTVVAVLDTGVVLHPEFGGVVDIASGFDFVSDPLSALDGDGRDASAIDPGDRSDPSGSSSWHGTHVAGTVAARAGNGGVVGTLWQATVIPVRVLGKFGGTNFDIADGIRYAAGAPNSSGRVPSRPAAIINLSLSGISVVCPQAIQEAVAAARARGAIVIAAAGNEGTSEQSQPALCDGVVSVAATDRVNARAVYSQFNGSVDVAAPGGDESADRDANGVPDGVLSTYVSETTTPFSPSFDRLQGTSMAAPHVSGVAGLMRTVNPSLTPAQFDGLLVSGAITRDVTGNGQSVRDDESGYGLIDAFRAVSEARRLATGGGAGAVPGSLLVTPDILDFGATSTAGTITLSNGGQGSLTITSVASTQPWLRVAPQQVDAQGLGRYSITVDRAGLPATSHSARANIQSSAGAATATVSLRVSTPSAGNVGDLYVLIVDVYSGQPVAETFVSAANGVYNFRAPGVRPGFYAVFAGSDVDNDQLICDAGESCGALGTLSDPTVFEVRGGDATLRSFSVLPDAQLLGSGTPPAPKQRDDQFVLKRRAK